MAREGAGPWGSIMHAKVLRVFLSAVMFAFLSGQQRVIRRVAGDLSISLPETIEEGDEAVSDTCLSLSDSGRELIFHSLRSLLDED